MMSERAAFIVDGDYRGPDPNAPCSSSRAQLYINLHQCVGGSHGPNILNRATATRTEEGCVVEWSLLIGICGDNALAELVCPSIDGRMVLRSNGNGGWTGNVNEDKYPARGIYWWRGDYWEEISKRPQGIFLDLYGWRKHIEDLRIARDAALPPGCVLQ